jgi:hypothetical protein
MSAADTGGPAFPQYSVDIYGVAEVVGGMTLRDQFAIAALSGIFGIWNGDTNGNKPFPILAGAAYAMADAMLAERSKP